jgi:hypothetical protein
MPTEPTVVGRIFIVGAPRSGTTLVQSLLAAHSAVTSFTESHFFDGHFFPLPWVKRSLLTRNPAPRVRAFLAENGEAGPAAAEFFAPAGRWELRLRALLPFATRRVACRLLDILDELAFDRGASHWVEKTPRHLHHLALLDSLSKPAMRTTFVHVIRRGLDVVVSLNKASRSWQRHYDLDTCARRWNGDLGMSLRRVDSPDDHFVFYEELTTDPEEILVRLLEWLGLAWEPQILDTYADAAAQLVTSSETWKAGVGREIRPSTHSEGVLSDEQRRWVTRRLKSELYEELRARVAAREQVPSSSSEISS